MSLLPQFCKLSILEMDFFSKLPAEVLIKILKSVTGKDIVSCKRLNIRLYYLIDKNGDNLPKIRLHCPWNHSVVIFFQSDTRAQSKSMTGWNYKNGVNARRNFERQLQVAANSREDTCYFDCDSCALTYRHWVDVPKARPIVYKRQLISLKHYSFDSIKIRRPVNLNAVVNILKTGNSVVKNLHIDINTNPELIKEIVGLFIPNLTEITFEFCDPTACLNEEFLNQAQKLSEVTFMYCPENRMHIAEKLAQNHIFFDKINFKHCNLRSTDLNEYIKEFLFSDQKEKTISIYVKEDEQMPNRATDFVEQSTNIFHDCQMLFGGLSSNITSKFTRVFGGDSREIVEMNVGGKKMILEFSSPQRFRSRFGPVPPPVMGD